MDNVDPTGFRWQLVAYDNGGSGWVWFDDATGQPGQVVQVVGDEITVSAPGGGGGKPAEPGPPNTDFLLDQAEFLRAGDQYFNAGGGASVDNDYSGSLKATLASAFEHGVHLSDLTGEKPTAGLVGGSVMGDPTILPNFSWSMAVGRDFHTALDLGGAAWDAGNASEALNQYLRATMDLVGLNVTVAVESGIAPAVILGAVLSEAGGTAVEVGAARGGTNISNLPRVGSGLKVDFVKPVRDAAGNIVKKFPTKPTAHGFRNVVDNFTSSASGFGLRNGATLYQIDGSLNGVAGRFEWIMDQGAVTHRMFVGGGTVNGMPIVS